MEYVASHPGNSGNKTGEMSSSASYYNTYNKKQYPMNSGWLIAAGLFSFLGGVFVIVAFSSPYWLASYESTYSQFVRLGLWETCFRNYRHPSYQFDEVINGCYYIFRTDYRFIKAWLNPGWMMFVQAMVSLVLITSLSCLIIVSFLVTRCFLFMEMLMITSCSILSAISGVLMFLSVCVFGAKAFDRSWLQYPNFNYLSWAYGLAVFTIFLFMFAFFSFIKEFYRARERRLRMSNLVFNMQRY